MGTFSALPEWMVGALVAGGPIAEMDRKET
jgi:hypothetical protein